jgi:hypothetical protein
VPTRASEPYVVRPCSEARSFVVFWVAAVLALLIAAVAGDGFTRVAAVALAAVVLLVVVRMLRARIEVGVDQIVIAGTFRTTTRPTEAVAGLSLGTTKARYWSWAWDSNLPAFKCLDLVVIRFADGTEVAPEASRRPAGQGSGVLRSIGAALSSHPSE